MDIVFNREKHIIRVAYPVVVCNSVLRETQLPCLCFLSERREGVCLGTPFCLTHALKKKAQTKEVWKQMGSLFLSVKVQRGKWVFFSNMRHYYNLLLI